MTEQSTPLTIHLYSFGFKFGGAPADESGHGGGFVFDCRALPNPFWDEALRPHAGNDAPIVEFMENEPEAQEFADHAWWLVRHAATTYARLGRERLMVSFGCTGGRHRSVYQAERLHGRLVADGFRVVLTHRDMQRPSAGEPL